MTCAKTAANAAAEVLLDYFQSGVSMRTKSASVDLVSDADVNAERAVASVIRDTFPDHQILGEEEESAAADAEHLWIVDPLDGTTNFAHGIPHFATSIAYYYQGQAMAGVVYNPVTKDWYIAEAGEGAFHNDRPMRVTDHNSLSEAVVGTGFYYDRGAMMEDTLTAVGALFRENIHGIRRFGAASLDFAAVASGQFSAYFEYQLFAWDFAAGRLLVEEAGGQTSDCEGNPLKIGPTTILATNGHLHQQTLQLIRRPNASAASGK